eukprot:GHVT01102035.1.p2 GENE.GHVT01102035.1~~GHVT01102035.1.p2  ORF type:complete len:109 (+),score=16.37 GHVT01102035.1:450-776(+)
MPPGLLAEFEDQGALTIVKGDCNYRRLIGNRWWKNDDDFQLITSYFPTPVVALRTLKADVGCGMSATATANAARDDPKWMTNGRWGVIQFGTGCRVAVSPAQLAVDRR